MSVEEPFSAEVIRGRTETRIVVSRTTAREIMEGEIMIIHSCFVGCHRVTDWLMVTSPEWS